MCNDGFSISFKFDSCPFSCRCPYLENPLHVWNLDDQTCHVGSNLEKLSGASSVHLIGSVRLYTVENQMFVFTDRFGMLLQKVCVSKHMSGNIWSPQIELIACLLGPAKTMSHVLHNVYSPRRRKCSSCRFLVCLRMQI